MFVAAIVTIAKIREQRKSSSMENTQTRHKVWQAQVALVKKDSRFKNIHMKSLKS